MRARVDAGRYDVERVGFSITKITDKYRMLMPDTETGDPGCPMCMEPLLTILNTEIFAGVASAEVGSAMRGGDVTF